MNNFSQCSLPLTLRIYYFPSLQLCLRNNVVKSLLRQECINHQLWLITEGSFPPYDTCKPPNFLNQKYTQGVQCHIHHLHKHHCWQRQMWLLRQPPNSAERPMVKPLPGWAGCVSDPAAVKHLSFGKMSHGDQLLYSSIPASSSLLHPWHLSCHAQQFANCKLSSDL